MLNELEIIYLVITIPLMFGLVLVGFGFSKLMNSQKSGIVSLILGICVIVACGFGFWYFSEVYNSAFNTI